MKVMKIVFAAVALVMMTGCMSTSQYGSYKERQIERKCIVNADKQAQNAYIRRQTDVRFADSQKEAMRANQMFQKKIASIETSKDRCLSNGQRRVFEEQLRRTTNRMYNRSYY
jgi:hypothetical protein